MIRLVIETVENELDGLYIKIGDPPGFVKKVDSYYLFDFMEISDDLLVKNKISRENVFKFTVTELINYWTELLSKTETGKSVLLPFDFQDEYVGGFKASKLNEGFKVNIAYSDEIHGYEVNKTVFDKLNIDRKIGFLEDGNFEWLMSRKEIYDGLNTSLHELAR